MSSAQPIAATRGIVDPFPFLVAAFCLLWSSAFAVAKMALADCPPLLLLAARFLLAGLVMLGLAAARGGMPRLAWRDLLALALLGVFNNALYLGLNYVGMRGVSAGLAAIVISANPVLTALLATFFLAERMSWRKATGLVLGVGGVGFIVESRLGLGAENAHGIVLIIAAVIALAAGTILFKRLAPGGGLWVGNAVQNLAGGLALAPAALATESIGEVVPSWRLLLALAYLVLLVSILAYLLWFHLLTVAGATAASAYHFLMPPLGLLFGWLLLGETAPARDFIGILPVALGIWLVTRPGRPTPTASDIGSAAGKRR